MTTHSADVVIIGAGAAGLYAAAILQQNQVDVAVLEARERIGGRLLSPVVDGGRVDLGATWFWANEPRIGALIGDGDLPGFPQRTEGDMMYQPDTGDAQRMQGNQLGTPAGRVASGMQSIPELLNDQLSSDTVFLNTEVTHLRLADERVSIQTTGDSWSAQHLVLAVPPALAVSRISFDTELPGPLSGLAQSTPIWMGSTVKVVATFDRPFWRNEGLAGSAFSYAGPMREIHDMSGPDGTPAAIFGFCAVPVGADAPTQEEILKQLVELFGEEAASPAEVHIMDWRAEAFTSPPNVEHLTNYQTFGHPEFQKPTFDGRLHWASTETSPIAPGHIEGAFAAAERAANAILTSLESPELKTGAS